MQRFALIHGDDAKARPPAGPVNWAFALCVMLVGGIVLDAAWFVGDEIWRGIAPTNFSEAPTPATLEIEAYAMLVIDIFAYGALALAACAFARSVLTRNPAQLGLGPDALSGAPLWLFAGLLVSIPTLAPFFSLAPGWLDAAARALLVLIPSTIVQAGAEEILFRGVLLSALGARYGALRALLISSALFGLWHIYLGQPAPDMILMFGWTFAFGMAGGVVALHQGHLGGAIILHVVWNLVSHLSAGLAYWPEPFWSSFAGSFNAPDYAMTYWDMATISATLTPLAIELAFVAIVARATILKLVARDEVQNRSTLA